MVRPFCEIPAIAHCLFTTLPSRSRILSPFRASHSAARPATLIVSSTFPSGVNEKADDFTGMAQHSVFVGKWRMRILRWPTPSMATVSPSGHRATN